MLKFTDRKGTDCAKWDGLKETFGADDLTALWVADMDIRVDDHIMDAISDYLKTGVFGYYMVPDAYYNSFIKWEREEHGLEIDREWISFTPGVVTGFHMAIQVLTEPGDSIIVNTPVYYPFLNAITNNNRILVANELVCDGGRYSIDLEDFENKIKANNVKAYILCSPHNPVSRVWTADELRAVLDICRSNNVAVIADEIHHDLVFGDSVHVPALSVAEQGDRIIMLTAASKSFNIAGLQNSFAVIRNEELRKEWDAYTLGTRIQGGNALGYVAVQAAYEHGKPWLEEVKQLVQSNYDIMKSGLEKEFEGLVFTPLEGTYLAWVDFGAYLGADELQPFMQDKCGLAFDYGSWFGGDRSGTHIRVNLATDPAHIHNMVKQIKDNLRGEIRE